MGPGLLDHVGPLRLGLQEVGGEAGHAVARGSADALPLLNGPVSAGGEVEVRRLHADEALQIADAHDERPKSVRARLTEQPGQGVAATGISPLP